MTDDNARYILREYDVIITDDVYDAMSDGFMGTCLHIIVTSGKLSFRNDNKKVEAETNDCIIMPNRTLLHMVMMFLPGIQKHLCLIWSV